METVTTAVPGARFVERKLESACVIDGAFQAGFAGVRHAHDGHHFLFVVSGCLEDHGLPRAERFHPSDVRESPCQDRHLLRATIPTRVVLVTLHASADVAWPDMPRLRRVHSAHEFAASKALVGALDQCRPDALDLEERVLALFATPDRSHAPHRPWLAAVRDRLYHDWRSIASLGEICREIGVSREHVARAFRERYGCTMREYTRQRQLAFVREHLASDTPLAALASEAGFADQSHMTRVVSRAFGAPPHRLRRQLTH